MIIMAVTPVAYPAPMAATMVLVHGAWHGAWCWGKVLDGLARRQVPAVAVDLPGHGDSPEPLGDLYGDAAHLVSVLDGIPGAKVLCGHSYGGAVITQAAVGRTDISRLVYLAAFCPDTGETVLGLAQSTEDRGRLGEAMRPGAQAGTFELDPDAAVAALYADCDPPDVAWAVERLCPQPVATFTQAVTGAPWRSIPSTFVVCTRDEAIAPSLQRRMAERCTTTVELASAHSPFLSVPDAVVDVLAGVAAG